MELNQVGNNLRLRANSLRESEKENELLAINLMHTTRKVFVVHIHSWQ